MATTHTHIASDDELREYIWETINRLERLAERLKTYAEENNDGRGTSDDDSVQ